MQKIWTGQLLRKKAVATSFLPDPKKTNHIHGHEARITPMAYVCKRRGLPDDIALKILAMVEPLDMYQVFFPKPGQKSWLTYKDVGIRK